MEFLNGRGAARAIGDITCPWWLFLFFYIDLTYHCFLILQRNNKISGVKRKQNKHNKMGRNRKEVFIMRKMITMAVTAALAISTLTACGKTDKKETTASTAATTASTASTAATTASTEAKTEAKAEAKDTSAAAAESKADAQTPVSGRHLQRQIQMLPLLTTQLVLVLESLLYLRDAAISVFPAVH